MVSRRFVIVGAGPAAASAAGALRSDGFDGQVLVIGEERVAPYERPPLSKEYLLGKLGGGELAVPPLAWYEEYQVDLQLGTRVERIEERDRAVVLGDGQRVRYDKLLITTGGRPRRLQGIVSDRVVYLRTLADAGALAERLRSGCPLVVLGGGFIGCEVAAAARQLGVEVTVLEMAEVPLQHALGKRFGAIVAEIHRDAGVRLRTSERVVAVADTGDGLVVTTDRGRIECGLLLAGVGMVPNVEIVAGTGIRCENGILVDEHCRTTVPDVFAAGDVAAHLHPTFGRHIRVEHHDNALKQGTAAARNMVGANVPYDDPHWFWSDQYAHNLQSVGVADGCDEVVVRGSLDDRCFSAFSLSGGRVRAVFALNRGKDVMAGRRLIASGVPVEAAQLRDESVEVKRLVPRRRS